MHCGEEVKRRRLEAVPWTPFCIRCQEAADCGDEGVLESIQSTFLYAAQFSAYKRAPAKGNFAFSHSRQFAIREHLKVKLLAQVFNIFNNTTFSLPGVSLSSPSTFGFYGRSVPGFSVYEP